MIVLTSKNYDKKSGKLDKKVRSALLNRLAIFLKMTMQLSQKTAFLPFQDMLVTIDRTAHRDSSVD